MLEVISASRAGGSSFSFPRRLVQTALGAVLAASSGNEVISYEIDLDS